jgi:maltose/moltooligosaccharide transporter
MLTIFKEKPKLSMAQIFWMSAGFFGIQTGFALQNGNASRILRSFGADVEELPMFWIVAPLVGMIVQPIIGHFSDKTWNKLGRRKPYFLTGAILSSIALIFLPNSALLSSIIPVLWIGASMVMIMDASFNVAMEPFRALVADNLPEKQRTTGFAIQTFLIGGGAWLGSNLPSLLANQFNVSKIADASGIAPNIKYAFYIGAALFMIAILLTVVFTKEYPPKEYEEYHGKAEVTTKSGFASVMDDFKNMPKTMRQLGLVQFFSWFALFSMWVFTTDAVSSHIAGIPLTDTKSEAYNTVGNTVGSSFGTYNLVSALFALCLPYLAAKIGRKFTHSLSLIAGGIGLISIYFLKDINNLHYSMVGVGLAWGSILAMPYVILSSSIPPGKMGIYMGIFNFFITLPQIINGIVGGSIVKHLYGGQPIYAIVLAGIFMICGAISVIYVYEPTKEEIAKA